VLLLDGCLVALLGVVAIAVLQPVGAIEGRPAVDETPYVLMVVPIALGLAYVWAGQRALRGIRRGRAVGIVLALLLAVAFGALVLDSRSSPGELAFALGLAALQVLVVLVLARWPTRSDRHA
jgi:hypothetical protein